MDHDQNFKNLILDYPRDALVFFAHNELKQYRTQYPAEASKMTSFAERYREEGMQKGMQQGLQQGEMAVLLRLMEGKFGHRLTEDDRRLIETADTETLLKWSDRILSANGIEEILH